MNTSAEIIGRYGDANVVFAADCPSRPILDQIADKWSMVVMAVLERPHRFNELKHRLDGITQRVLTQTLRRLQRNGMMQRRVLPISPVGVEYSLTTLGESLRQPFTVPYEWTVMHSGEIQTHQRNYDRRTRTDSPTRRRSDPAARPTFSGRTK